MRLAQKIAIVTGTSPNIGGGIAEGLAEGDLSALYLLQSDPLRDLADARRLTAPQCNRLSADAQAVVADWVAQGWAHDD